MPSAVALILCIAFVLFLLWLDKKQAPEASIALWIPTVWMLIVASKPVGTWCGQDPGDASPFDQVFYLAISFVALIVLIRRKFSFGIVVRENKWLVFALLYMIISVAWSQIPSISFKRWTRELIALIMACVVLSEPNPRRSMESIIRRCAYVLIPFSLLLIRYFPLLGRAYGKWTGEVEWIGVTMQKNGIGRVCMLSGFFILWSLFLRWRGRKPPVWKFQKYVEIIILIMTVYLLKGPNIRMYSATGASTLIIGLLIFFGLLLSKKSKSNLMLKLVPLIAVIIILIGIATPFTGGSLVGGFTGSLGRNSTLTGRTDIWRALMPFVSYQPVLGSGIGAFWTKEVIASVLGVNEAHNGYLGIILQFGFLGLIIFLIFYLISIKRAIKIFSYDPDWNALWISYVIMVLVHNISESSIQTFANQLPAFVLFLTVSNSYNSNSHKIKL